jgi:polysaccharide chain length determinant protein (PEP-CTERM system associated)
VVIALAIALGLPPVYEAETTILIEAATIREDIVATTVVADKESRFQQTRLRLLARDGLSTIIQGFDLYSDMDSPMEDKVLEMRRNITIEPILPRIIDPRRPIEVNSVRMAFRSESPEMTAEVANSLAREFIRLNLEARAADAQGTSDFLDRELLREERALSEVLSEISAYKEAHTGELPSQLMNNRVRLERLNAELSRTRAELEAAQSQVGLIQRQLQESQVIGGVSDESPSRRLQQLETTLGSLRANGLTEKHPDVRMTMAEIAVLEEQLAAPQEERPQPISDIDQRRKDQLRDYKVRADVRTLEVERIVEDVARYEIRIENTPKRAAELAQMESRARSHDEAIRAFRNKKALADIAKSLEARQKGEKFRVIETAQIPSVPVEPNRPLVFLIGVVLGLMAGIALLVVRELSDPRFYSLSDLQESLPVPVLATVPVIRLPSEIAEMRARIRRWGLSSAAALLVTLLIGGAVYFFAQSDGGVPEGTTPAAAGTDSGDV